MTSCECSKMPDAGASAPTVADIVRIVEKAYPPHRAESWDTNGLICGHPDDGVSTILVGLDPVAALGREALESGADFILTHHPLFLRGTSSVAATTPKGALVHTLISNGIALMNSHTNADVAHEGVAQACAEAFGLVDVSPMDPCPDDPSVGLGRVGRLPQPMTFGAFARHVAACLPASAPGLLGAGDEEAIVSTVLVSPGAGDSFLARSRELGVDVYVTADLRHHPASEHVEGGKPFLLGATHWATESLWISHAAAMLRREIALAFPNADISVKESTIVTEPWDFYLSTIDS